MTVKAEGSRPQQVFNCDKSGKEKGKKCQRGLNITQEDALMVTNQWTCKLLLYGNASRAFKFNPLLVYH